MEVCKIVVVGAAGVGKSSCILQFTAQRYGDYDPTIDDSYRCLKKIDGKSMRLEIHDTAMQADEAGYCALVRQQEYRRGEGFLFVYSITSESSFEELHSHYLQVLAGRDAESLKGIPAVVVGNKVDLEEQREVEYERGKCYADEIGAAFFETSAKSRLNLEEAFHFIARGIDAVKAIAAKEAARRKAAFVWYALKFSALPVEVVKRIAEQVDWTSGVAPHWKPAPRKQRGKCNAQ